MKHSQTVRIMVTTEDIRAGHQRSCELCPVSRAIRRSVLATAVNTGGGGVLIQHGQDQRFRKVATLPESALEWQRTWDTAGACAVEPFAFDLEILA